MLDELKWRFRLGEARQMLDAELKLIKAGAIADLAAGDSRREALADRLAEMPEEIAARNETALRELRAMAARNEKALKAYVAGASDAIARLAALDKSGREIGAYRQDGTRLPGAGAGPTRESRA